MKNPPPSEPVLSFPQKCDAVVKVAVELSRAGGDYRTVYDGVYTGSGVAKRLFTTPEDRSKFIETEQYRFVARILDVLLRKSLQE